MIRILWAVLAVLLLTLLIVICVHRGWGAAALSVAFGAMPDLALIGAFAGRGRLKPNRVGLYNLLHAVPLALIVASLGGVLGALGVDAWMLTVAGIAWIAHIAVDRACGYGLRATDGAILPVSA